ncbi:protein adenylyltransferase SelO [Aquidulcibacter paucihalophilus]|uniref:protein adenylyltransferase SelO n=1 Tax=Aquidulcibacter paucihalophilus TaxID=1978549 RepID=UPI000A195EEC|nr:YdiU family protein [Aquidulcibacter paucihalophilus]
MPVSSTYQPDPHFYGLGPEFGDPVEVAEFPMHRLVWRDQRAAQRVGLDTLSDAEWVAHFGRFESLPNMAQPPVAMRYHGHQFRTYNPQLGDGRGFLFGQLRDQNGRLLDLGTKGSGQTPWSRQGDGRLTLKGGVREVLAARMLEAQGVNTSKALSLIETGENLIRSDEPSPTRSAVLVRLQHSHVRFGTFQRHAFLDAPERLTALVDHCVALYYPHLQDLEGPARAAALVREVALATAEMVAGWMAAGFVHGVLNTDNMNVTGESFDYGPWRFLPVADGNFTAAYFDQTGLYAYGRQPEAGLWNLKQLAGALTPIGELESLTEAVRAYPPAFAHAQQAALLRRLGLKVSPKAEDSRTMLDAMFAFMARSGVSWDGFFHDWFGGLASEARAMAGPRATFYQGEDFKAWVTWLDQFAPERPERLSHAYFQTAEPASLVIEEVEALWARIAEQDDWSGFHQKLADIDQLGLALA